MAQFDGELLFADLIDPVFYIISLQGIVGIWFSQILCANICIDHQIIIMYWQSDSKVFQIRFHSYTLELRGCPEY